MAGKQMGGGGFEAELQRIRTLDDAMIPRMSAVINAFTSLERALSAVRLSEHWKGSSADGATADIDEIRANVSGILETVKAVDTAIGEGNSTRREIAAAELPSASIDPFWANAAKGASFVVHPVLGPLAADTALDAIGDFLGNQREDRARQIVNDVESSLVEPTNKLDAATTRLNEFDYVSSDPSKRAEDPLPRTQVDRPNIVGTPGFGGGPSGYTPGGGGYQPPTGGVGEYEPPISTNPTYPTYPTYPTEFTPPTDPTFPDGPDWEYDPDGPGGPGGSDDGDPTVDFPGGGVLPGGPGGTGGSNPLTPGSTFPGGTLPGGGSGIGGIGGGIGGVVGGGAGAAAIAAGSKIAGIGSMGALGGSGIGGASGAGLKAGGGLLGNSAAGGAGSAGRPGGIGGIGGVGGVGGAGGAGGASGSSGAAGSGMRPGMGMMGGAGGDEEEKAKRSGLGGPIAPKLEDEEERGPRAKGAQAGSRDDHAG